MIGKARLALIILARYVRVRFDLRRYPLPELVGRYSALPPRRRRYPVRTLGRGVERLLLLPGRPLRCLPRALVLYSLVVEQSHDARLMVGLPDTSATYQAHAWVEIGGVDIGPSPGRDGHQALASYPLEAT
ncbi:MAG TPA: lasso peptide biosynthesis B2 protein [Acidimicrobiia bacterium]|nr:lasso peptide biosynthesis B2 protein [Acidimicrobiia bacterium]